MNEQIALQNALRTRLQTAQIRYPRYSVRALAKRAGISPATLSLVLRGKRKISQKMASRISERLSFDPQERADIHRKYLEQKALAAETPTAAYVQLTVDQYQLLADWRAFAVLNLIPTKGFRAQPAWIARRLAIAPAEAEATLKRLLRLGMVEETADGLRRKTPHYRTTEDIANLSLQQSHRQTLELAQAAIGSCPVEQRDFTWLTFPLDPAKLPLAKTLIRKFQDDLLAALAEGAEPTEVYRMAVQLFPLTAPRPAKGSGGSAIAKKPKTPQSPKGGNV